MIGPPIARLAAAGREGGGGGDARIVSYIMNAAFPLLLLEESKRRRKEQKGKFGRSYGNRAAHNIINGGKAVEGSWLYRCAGATSASSSPVVAHSSSPLGEL